MRKKMNHVFRKVLQLASWLPVLILMQYQVYAQTPGSVSGVVMDEKNQPLPGVTIEATDFESRKTTAMTDDQGKFYFRSLPVGKYNFTFSFVGYSTSSVTVNINAGENEVITRSLTVQNAGMDEVVVTALGINRKKESLGFTTQKVDGGKLTESPASNFISGLNGKIAGVNISSAGSVGGSARITMRGESSLNMQNSQPLFIIDGVPVSNDRVNNTSGGADYGSSTAEINPADIESVNVLKGAAASALYGSRAGNGAIIITTKKGANRRGVGVSFNSYYFMEEVGRLPKFQDKFGQGSNGQYEGSNFGASWSKYPNGIEDSYDESWGPRLDVGTDENQFDSPTSNGYRAADVALDNRGDIIATPWVSQPDNVKDFFVKGHKLYNNIAFSGGNENGNYRLSLTSLNEKGVIPNNDLKRYIVSLNSSYNLAKNLTSSINLNYVKQESDNRPDNGYGRNTFMYFFTWMGRNVNINSLKDYWTKGLDGIRQFQYNYGENHNNPFFMMHENTKGQDKDRLYGNISLDYTIVPKLKIKLRTAQDGYDDFRPMRWAVSTVDYENGRYEEVRIKYTERNTDLLLTYNNAVADGDFTYSASAGANRLDKSTSSQNTAVTKLLVPGVYNLGNAGGAINAGSYLAKKRINSVYGMLNFGYKETFYLDITGRNDWSSTLPENNNAYFYPSISFNTNLKKLVNLPAGISKAELRLNWAQVGNDADSYQLYNTFNYSAPWLNYYALTGPSSLLNPDLKPEISHSYEIGTAWGFFHNRLNVDITYYDKRSKNQIIGLPLARSSGAFSRLINAGELQNRGIELMLNGVPVSTRDFRWNVTLNLSHNTGKVLSLSDEVDRIVQSAPGEDASIQARVGEKMGAIYGPGYQRVQSGPMQGEIIIFPDGSPRGTSELVYLGNINPDVIGGLYQEFTYKNFSLNFLFAGQFGGKFISRFYNKAAGAGQLIETAKGREARAPGTEYNDPYYIPGAAEMTDKTYQPNNTSTDGTYSAGVYGIDVRGFIKKPLDHISEAQLFSTTYVKLRELSFGYALPAKILGRSFVKGARISLTGRNLLLFTPKSNQHFDPEVAVATAGDGLIPGFENMSVPSTREMGISLNLNF